MNTSVKKYEFITVFIKKCFWKSIQKYLFQIKFLVKYALIFVVFVWFEPDRHAQKAGQRSQP